ncbi:hypothetical protein BC939DRAFT_532591 [Gamsiella multidivaricata]|uniref:uncharacterized protein n=1 Tax=Gamsiella multidivaricata TaxID=101098 RepID=UPI0022211CC3|nr:uncharacterized protein BC939DRAFT_532591 [Gamsiella multidivaricata]KAI7817677.1 hypothetical protein BC939DRAFT_532591 [Gamsiella multidivaricata]
MDPTLDNTSASTQERRSSVGSTSTCATLSVLSRPITDPHYRELQALRSDYSALQTKLKLTQETAANKLRTHDILSVHEWPSSQGVKDNNGAKIKVFQETDKNQDQGGKGGQNTTQQPLPPRTWEIPDMQKILYEKLQDENMAMNIELQDLRHHLRSEKDSSMGYMSLFESIQKKQSNALAVSQFEIEFLRGTVQEHRNLLESRESLIQSLITIISAQAVDIETLTTDSCRERFVRAQVEQEIASLLEASLSMLERWFLNIVETRAELSRVMQPLAQTIQLLKVPSIAEEWVQCERAVGEVMEDLVNALRTQQETQERELMMDLTTINPATVKNISAHSSNVSIDNGNRTYLSDHEHRRSTGSAHSTLSALSGSTKLGRNGQGKDGPELDTYRSQEVFIWRKFKADTFLEECVKGVEILAGEKRELQTRLAELMCMENPRAQEDMDTIKTFSDQAVDRNVDQEIDSSGRALASDAGAVQQQENHGDEPDRAIHGVTMHGTNLTQHNQRLELILSRILDWADLQASALKSSSSAMKHYLETESDTEDSILALGISDGPLESSEQASLSVMGVESEAMHASVSSATLARQPGQPFCQGDWKSRTEKLEELLQLIRQEFSMSASKEVGETIDPDERIEVATQSKLERSSDMPTMLLSFENVTLREDNAASRIDSMTTIAIKTARTRPEQLRAVTSPSPSSSSSSVPSSSESSNRTSSGSGYISRRYYIAGLSMVPSSPSLGGFFGRSGGKSVLDVDKLYRDLAFRSFPKQHQ